MSMLSLPVLAEAAARASVILAASGLVAAALRRSSASARHLVWALGLVAALVVPALSVALPKWELPIVRVEPSRPAPVAVALNQAAAVRDLRAETTAIPARAGAIPAKAGSHGPVFERNFSRAVASASRSVASAFRRNLAITIWAIGAALVLGRMLLGLIAVRWMSRRTREVTDGPWLPLARQLARDFGLENVRFVQSATASMPMAWGLWRASVLMPADAETWPSHRLRVVLLHELAHVKRRDCLTHVIAQIVSAAYWFNPLVWVAVRRLRSERERACDDLVLAAGTPGADYADELLDIARVTPSQRFPAVMGGASLAMAHRSQLEGRLIAILDPTVPRRGLTRPRAAAAAGTFAILLLSVASVQPWAEERAAAPAQVMDKPIESYPGQAAADVRANARAQAPRQTKVQDEVQGQIQGRIQGQIQGAVGSVVEGVVGGVVDGVVEGVTGGIERIVESAIPFAAQNPRPNPNPDPRPQSEKRQADPRAVNALMEALKDTDKEVRETAMHALVQMRDPRIYEPLVAALKDASPDVREQAAFGLGQLRDPRAVEALTSVLHDSNPDVREQAVFALSQIRDKRAVDPLVSALKDENPDVRQQAAFALGQIRDAKAVEPLVIALKDGNADVREQAAFALGQIRDPRAIDALTAALKDGNVDVRRQAAFALGQIRY